MNRSMTTRTCGLVASIFLVAGLSAPVNTLRVRARPRWMPSGARSVAVRHRRQVPGFSLPDSQGVMRGMDADSCRAVAAAALGDARR